MTFHNFKWWLCWFFHVDLTASGRGQRRQVSGREREGKVVSLTIQIILRQQQQQKWINNHLTIDKGTRHGNNNNNDNGHKTVPLLESPLSTNCPPTHAQRNKQMFRICHHFDNSRERHVRNDKSLQIDWRVLKITEKNNETTKEQLTIH